MFAESYAKMQDKPRGMMLIVNGTAVLEYGNHLPSSVCLNDNGRLIADMGYPC